MDEKVCVVRISGQVGLNKDVKETFKRLRLKKKYSCAVIDTTKENIGMLNKVRDFVAFGEIDTETHKKLNEKRKSKIKNVYRLHPPRGGIKSKLHHPKGVLGNNGKEINKLVERML